VDLDELAHAFEGLSDTQLNLCGPPLPQQIPAGLGLPARHCDVLGWTNGFMAYGGYFRLFGVGGGSSSIEVWNAIDTWKFAWSPRVREFLCFAETAWGDQFAYARSELAERQSAKVYLLEAVTMQPEIVAVSFEQFFGGYFLRNCTFPADEMLKAARNKVGNLTPIEHVLYVPSILISGTEMVDAIEKMPATAAMIINGDIAKQLAHAEQSRAIERIEQYVDERGRSRLKVVWAR